MSKNYTTANLIFEESLECCLLSENYVTFSEDINEKN